MDRVDSLEHAEIERKTCARACTSRESGERRARAAAPSADRRAASPEPLVARAAAAGPGGAGELEIVVHYTKGERESRQVGKHTYIKHT